MKRIARIMGAAVLAALLLVIGAGPGFGKPILDEAYGTAVGGSMKGGRIVTEKGGQSGWQGPGGSSDRVRSYIEYDATALGLSPIAGTLEMRLVKYAPQSGDAETLFTLVDAKGKQLYFLRIAWAGDDLRGEPVFGFYNVDGLDDPSHHFYVTMRNLNYPGSTDRVPASLGKRVADGQTVHIALTWSGQTNSLYVDGRKISARSDAPLALPAAIAKTQTIVVGAETSTVNPNGAWDMMSSVVTDFRIHDRALTPSEFAINPSAISAVSHDAASVAGYSGALVEGDELAVTMTGAAGGRASFDIGQRASSRGEIPLDWRGYYDGDVNEIKLEDVTEYRVYTSPAFFTLADVEKFRFAQANKKIDLGAGAYAGITEAKELRARDMVQRYTITGLDSDQTLFVMVTAVDSSAAKSVSYTDASGAAVSGAVDVEEAIIAPIGGIAMGQADPGVYKGKLKIAGDVQLPAAFVVGHLVGADERESTMESEDGFAIDTAVRILVKASPSVLKADEKSTSRLTVELRNANGDTVSGHKVGLSIATTSEYTGIIGGGKFVDAVGGNLSLDFSGETDAFGTVQATFTAGFAAKTAIIVARDMKTNDTGAGFVQQYIEGTTDIELVGLRPSAAKSAGYSISVTSDREWLTADGSSQAKIKAQVLQNGNPVAGHTVVFSVVGEGRIKTVNAVTDATGSARAVYTAGTKIGLVLVKATDVTIGLSGSVQIELRSDAPAKIAFTVDVLDAVAVADSTGKGLPELYADGRSKANVTVLITDINDNPNKDTTVSYAIIAGSGSLEDVKAVTDTDGKSYATFKAGMLPGTATIKVTVSSNVPTATESAAAQDAVLTVPDFEYITE